MANKERGADTNAETTNRNSNLRFVRKDSYLKDNKQGKLKIPQRSRRVIPLRRGPW